MNNFNDFEYEDLENFPLESLKKIFNNIGKDGANIDVKVVFNDQIMNLIKELENNMAEDPKDEMTCPNCGTKLSDIKFTQMVGCEVCYSYFKNEINSFLRSKNLLPCTNKKHSRLDDLRRELDIAIRTENYEKAAEIKQEMENLYDN